MTGRYAVRGAWAAAVVTCGDGAVALRSVSVVEQAEMASADATAMDAVQFERKVGKQAPEEMVDIDSRIDPVP